MLNDKDYSVRKLGFNRDRLKIYGNLYLPAHPKTKAICIMGHGFGATYRSLEADAKAFARAGIASYIFDFCGGSPASLSDGSVSDMSVLTERDDMEAVMDGLMSLRSVDRDNIFLAGQSQGGFVAALLAAKRPEDVKGLILFFPALVIPDDARRRFDNPDHIPEISYIMGMKIGQKYSVDVYNLDPFKEIIAYTKDVLIIHGDQDELVPISYSQRAVKAYTKARLITIQGAGHGFYGSDLIRADRAAIDYVMAHAG